MLRPYFTDDNLFIISSDFSHYPSYEDAYEVDTKTGKAIETGDVEQLIATIENNADSGKRNLATSACGEFPIITLMLMLNHNYEIKHLMYQNSGDIDNHDHSRVVGYHAFAFLRKQISETEFTLTDADKKQLKEIALQSIKDSSIASLSRGQLFILNYQFSTQSAAPSFLSTNMVGFVVVSDTLVKTILCMRL